MLGPHAEQRAGIRHLDPLAALQSPADSAEAGAVLLHRHEVHGRRADEAGDEHRRRVRIELERRADLLDAAGVHHHQHVGQRHGLDLVVGDVDRGGPERAAAGGLISTRICTRSLASRLDSGSSNRNTCGSRTMARPMATRWRWPPESSRGLRLEEVVDAEHARGFAHAPSRSRPWACRGCAGRRPCCRRRSCADRARSSGTPWRCRARRARRR